MLESLNDHRQLVAGAVAVITAYIYGVAYFALTDYYNAFGLHPSDAGVTQATLVAIAGTATGALSGWLFVGVAVGWLTYRFIKGATDEPQFSRRQTLGFVLSAGVCALMVAAVRMELVAVTLILMSAASGLLWVTSSVTWHERPVPRNWRPAAGAALLLVAALSWIVMWEVVAAAERLGGKARRDGGYQRESAWEFATRMGLNLNVVPVDARGNPCALLIAYAGDHAWVMESPGETVEINRVERKSVTVRYSSAPRKASERPKARPCWRQK